MRPRAIVNPMPNSLRFIVHYVGLNVQHCRNIYYAQSTTAALAHSTNNSNRTNYWIELIKAFKSITWNYYIFRAWRLCYMGTAQFYTTHMCVHLMIRLDDISTEPDSDLINWFQSDVTFYVCFCKFFKISFMWIDLYCTCELKSKTCRGLIFLRLRKTYYTFLAINQGRVIIFIPDSKINNIVSVLSFITGYLKFLK